MFQGNGDPLTDENIGGAIILVGSACGIIAVVLFAWAILASEVDLPMKLWILGALFLVVGGCLAVLGLSGEDTTS